MEMSEMNDSKDSNSPIMNANDIMAENSGEKNVEILGDSSDGLSLESSLESSIAEVDRTNLPSEKKEDQCSMETEISDVNSSNGAHSSKLTLSDNSELNNCDMIEVDDLEISNSAGTSRETDSNSKQHGSNVSDLKDTTKKSELEEAKSKGSRLKTVGLFKARKKPMKQNLRVRLESDDSEEDENENLSVTNHSSSSCLNVGYDSDNHSICTSDFDSSSSSSFSFLRTQYNKSDTSGSASDKTPPYLSKKRPDHKWFYVQELINRQIRNCSKIQVPFNFQHRCYGSLHNVERLELAFKLKEHTGCVNALNFNQRGDLLLSGSDDQKCVMWNWAGKKAKLKFETGHRSNVFSVKFLPFSNDSQIVTCARDGQVRLATLNSNGSSAETCLLARHSLPVHKIATSPDSPFIILSCGEDGVVNSIDLRAEPAKVKKIIRGSTVDLYSIHCNPVCSYEFIIGGQGGHLSLYDSRNIPKGCEPLKQFYPKSLPSKPEPRIGHSYYITSAVFNHNGTEILASYNYDNIYLFDVKKSSPGTCEHSYEGHQNSATIKGVSFFGPSSEFIVSGSDCGNIFFWDKETESIVQCLNGDVRGVVNVLEPHPSFPFLATSGLDDDVKFWMPSARAKPQIQKIENIVKNNHKQKLNRVHKARFFPAILDGFDSFNPEWLIGRRRTRRHRNVTSTSSSSADSNFMSPSSDGSSSSSDGDGNVSVARCVAAECLPS